MRVVIQFKGFSISFKITEKDLDFIIEYLRDLYDGVDVEPLSQELFRRKIPKGAVIVFKKNKRERTRSEWLEYRALLSLSKLLNIDFLHSVQFWVDGIQREVDGVNPEEKIMVEVHWSTLDAGWLKYYLKKKRLLGFKKCIIVAKDIDPSLRLSRDDVEIYTFRLDTQSIVRHYRKDLSFPPWIRDLLGKRHIRILTNKGVWVGLRRRLSRTPRYSPEKKLSIELTKMMRKGKYPIKIYYSQARMVNPVAEFRGRGRPIPILIGVVDIDADKDVFIGWKNYLEKLYSVLRDKIEFAEETLRNLSFHTKLFFSGKKGFHIYFFRDGNPEFGVKMLKRIYDLLGDVADNITFRNRKGEYDLHRIIKLPGTIDQTTGYTIAEKPIRIPNDEIVKMDLDSS